MKKSEFKRYFSVLLALVMTMSIFGSYSVPTSATDLPSVLSLQYMSARTNDIIVDVTFDRNIATAPDIDVWQVYNATDKVLVNGINPISALTFQYAPGGALNKVRLFIMKSDFYTATNQTVEFKTTFGCENFTGIQSKIKFASNVVIQNGTDPSSVSFSEVGTIPNILSVQYIAERTNDVYVDLTFDMNVATSTEIEAWEIYNATGKVLVNGASPLSAFTFQYAPGGALNKVRLFIMKSDFASSNRQTLEFKTGFNCANFSSIAYAKKFRSNIVIANGTIANTVSFNSISLLPSILSAQYIGDRADPNFDVLIDFAL